MQIVLHCGAHQTDENRLMKTLLRNARDWHPNGIAVPAPGRYRRLLSDRLQDPATVAASSQTRDVIIDALLSDRTEAVTRVVLSHQNLFMVPKLMFTGGCLYQKAEERLQAIQRLFTGDTVELCMGIRNPATFLPAVFEATPHNDIHAFLNGTDPVHVRWSDLLMRLRDAVPEMAITVWCNEDTPLIWGKIVRTLAGLDPDANIKGAFTLLEEIMTPTGMDRLRAYLETNPVLTETHKIKIMAVFLEKFGIEDAMDEELDLPGWDAEYVDALTSIYDADLARIEAMSGVRVLLP